jgi:hypothetical protein
MEGVSEQTAATYYRRAAAGDPEATEVVLRCPAALLLTVDFLFQRVLDADSFGADPRFPAKAPVPDLLTIFEFLFNRTRSVRVDYLTQNYGSTERNDALVIEVSSGRPAHRLHRALFSTPQAAHSCSLPEGRVRA